MPSKAKNSIHSLKSARRRRAPRGAPMRFIKEVALHHDADECLIWPYGRNADGYARLNIEGRHVYGHVVVCEETRGPRPTPERQASHSCGQGHEGCIAPRHLTWKTPAENAQDRIDHGTAGPGKLTASKADAIRDLQGLLPYRLLAQEYHVRGCTISAIIRGKTWRLRPAP